MTMEISANDFVSGRSGRVRGIRGSRIFPCGRFEVRPRTPGTGSFREGTAVRRPRPVIPFFGGTILYKTKTDARPKSARLPPFLLFFPQTSRPPIKRIPVFKHR